MEFLVTNYAPIMFAGLIVFLLFGFPVAFSLGACGLFFGFVGIELGVLPEALLEPTRTPLQEMLRGGHRFEQLALADFIASGQFSRHLGRMRRLYRDRQHALREALTQHLGVPHRIEGGHCGLHLTVRLPSEYPDAAIAQAAQRYGIAPTALSGFALQPQPQDNGLVLGYGNTSAELFAPLVQRLGALARELQA